MELEFLNKLNLWLTSAQLQEQLIQLQEQLIRIKIVFILFGIFFLAAIFYLLFKSSFLRVNFWQDWTEFLSYKGYGLEKIHQKLRKIHEKIETGSESDWKVAILESEDLLNDVLEKQGFYGKTLEERLQKIEKEIIPNMEEILNIHKIYQNMIADPDYHLTLPDAQKFLDTIEEVLKNLGVI